MKLTRSQLKEIIREEIQKLNEKREIGGYYLMKQLKDLANDAKRNRERKLEKGLMYLHSRINQSYRDIDLSAKDVLDLFNDPRGRKYGKDVPSWMIEDLFEGVMERPKINEQSALFPVRVDMKVDFTDNETTEESFIDDIEKAIQGVIDTSGVNVSWTVNDYTIGETIVKLKTLIPERNGKLKEYMIKGVEVKDFVDEALKKAGIKVTKYLPMKSGWLGSKFVWGAFYTVRANKRKDILPFTVDKNGNLHLNVSPNKFIVGKIGKTSQVVNTLKDFKKSDLDVFESVTERK